MGSYIETVQGWITLYGMKVVGAIVILVVGRWIAKLIKALLLKIMERSRVEATLAGFAANLAYIGLMAFIIIAALEVLGIRTTSFVAVIAAAGLAIAFAPRDGRPTAIRDLVSDQEFCASTAIWDIFHLSLRSVDHSEQRTVTARDFLEFRASCDSGADTLTCGSRTASRGM